MALKYLQLPEPTYIPKYASVDPQVLGQVTSQIENQIQQGRQSLSALDQLEDNTSQALSILPDSYKQQYKEVLNRTRAQLDEDVEKYGYRNIQGKVRNLARDFQNEVAPLMQTAGQVSAAYKRIDESSADGMSKQVGRQAIQQALEGNADFSPPQYLAAFENWRDLRKEINDFASKWKEGTVSQREQVIDSPGGQYIYRSLIQSGRPDEFARAAALMLQDQQSLTQLEIMTRARRPDYDNLDNESKQKEVALTAGSIVDPNIINLSYIKETNVQREKIERESHLSILELAISEPKNPELSSVSGIKKMNQGYSSSINTIEAELNNFISEAAANDPSLVNARLQWNDSSKSYEIMDNRGNVVSQFVDASGRYVPNAIVANASIQRRYLDQEQQARQELLDKAVRRATNNEYSTFEQFINSDPKLKNNIEKLEKQQKGLSGAFDIYTQGYAAPGQTIRSDSDSGMSHLSDIELTSLSPTFGKINEYLRSVATDREFVVNPIRLSNKEMDDITKQWAAVKSNIGTLDKDGNQLDAKDLPNNATFLGVATTSRGIEFLWNSEGVRDDDKIYSGIVRTLPNPNIGNLVLERVGVDVQMASLGQQLARLSDPSSARKRQEFTTTRSDGSSVSFPVMFDTNTGSYIVTIPDEFRTGTQGYLQFSDVNEASQYIFNLQQQNLKNAK